MTRPIWPKSELLPHGPELPLEQRIDRYQHNIRAIRAAGCRVPTVAMPDTLDRDEIAAWFTASDAISRRLRDLISELSLLPDDTQVPSPFA